ncbi:probable receptor-like protein kinase At5g24010 [Gossypium raimondii]|uniref:probable receptor-like protein kinase At5g24010 n=1 Tax=Gossypium raimondii TaxID=29730 RepID=UPI00227B0538|nr:probable receptor-like protein kinase At5g24010 [Gossypium raimondii]
MLSNFHTKKVEMNYLNFLYSVSRCLLPSILTYTCLLYHLTPLMEKLQNLLLLQLLLLLSLSSAYTPPDKYFINCGSNSNVSGSGGRNFVGDLNSGVSFFVGQSSPVPYANPSSSQLYQSARIYRRPSFYEFVINESGTYFVRLHFFVSSSDSNLATAKFNVSASGFWLLSDFTLKNSISSPVIKDFLVTINVKRFRIYFIPSHGSNLAFVNAIEVFLTPEDFIPDTASRVTPAGSRISFDGLPSQVLHTLFRINVGGLTLTPENDTLWRNWIPDDSFLLNPMAARNSDFFPDSPNYREGGATEYTAPSPVYRTAKEMNIDESRQLNFFNVTWSFNVSKSSSHFVRVHFCDIISVSLNVTIFDLYIYNKFSMRINPYDKMGQLATPFYYDFVVDSDESGIMNISIGPRSDSQNQTAFLNGLEIMQLMKKSDFVSWPGKPESNKTSLFAIVGSIGGGSFVIILVAIVLLSLKRRKVKPGQSSSWPFSGPFYARSSSYNRMSEKTSNMLPSNLNLALRLSYHEIEQSTKNFDSNLVIGEGGFGKVYQGMFRGMKVAVKRSEPGHGQGLLEFQTEIVVLSQIRHRHLVSLIGYCDERFEMILVYEFMEQGTLRDHLYYSTADLEKSYSARSEFSWKQRLEICIGAAKGLNYLHTGAAGGIIHRDVKSTNILLDEQFVAKVADFGLSKSGIPDVEHSVDVKGTFGYLDPEYFMSLQLTDKSDVYSFGVVLLEVLCARPAVINSNRREEVNLAEWGMYWLRKGQLDNIIDPILVDTINPNSFRKFAETTEKCLKVYGSERPIMRDVLWDLEYALQLQLTPINRGPLEDSITNASLEFSMPVLHQLPSNSFPAVDEDNTTLVFDDTSDVTASEVFTELRIGDSR